MKTPLISVVMPVHNARPFLDESIASIVQQTFADFEFVILNDGSTDGSDEVLRVWAGRDRRIRLYRIDQRLGLAASSNLVVKKSRAAVIARMDADDISHPDRLKLQWQVLQREPNVVAVGTLCDGIDAFGHRVRPRDRWRVVRGSRYIPFPHGSVVFRRKVFELLDGYDEQCEAGEDQDFFFRMTSLGRIVTLPDLLYRFRYHSANATLLNGGTVLRSPSDQRNGHELAALYMLGAMWLWAGQAPAILPHLINRRVLRCDLKSLVVLGSSALGTASPAALRLVLRSFIRARDIMAGARVRDGRPYEWRLK